MSAPIPSADAAPQPAALVVEDHMETRIFLEAALQERFDVVAVAEPVAALDVARRRSFDVLVFDIALGQNEDGVELLQQLRERPEYAHVPALAVTAYALPRDRKRYLDAGFDAYLSKPFFQDDILQVVEQLLGIAPRTDTSPGARGEVE